MIIRAKNIIKTYSNGVTPLSVLNDVNFEAHEGDFIAVVGPSGAGKSTLLNILGLLDEPSGGDVLLEGKETSKLSEHDRSRMRNRSIGFVFQFHHLLGEFTACENVMMPALIRGENKQSAARRAEELLSFVGLSGRATHKPSELSGGEAQRVAVARALVNNPKIILADEPSGNLDHANALVLHELLHKLSRDEGKTVIVVTHNPELAARTTRTVKMEDGRIV